MALAVNLEGETLGSAQSASDVDDCRLLQRIADGDRAALHALYKKHYNPLLRFIYRITGDLDLAQEGINDVMLVVWQSAGDFGGRSKVSTWIMGIAYRKALKLAEKSRRWYRRLSFVDFHDWNEPSAPDAEHTLDADVRNQLEYGIGCLPPKQRAVLELTYRYGHSYEEIAEIAGCPVNTVKTRMFHARAKLKSLLTTSKSDETNHDERD